MKSQYRGTSGLIETIALVCEWHSPGPVEEIEKIIKRAWDWYVAYLKWEDEQFDNEEKNKMQ